MLSPTVDTYTIEQRAKAVPGDCVTRHAAEPRPTERFATTPLTLRIDDLDEVRRLLEHEAASMIEEPKPVPTGRNMRARHP